jgi:L-seryl-tRNA(Ser) seleniumtransferase
MEGLSTVGGGSLPEETLPTTLYSLAVRHPDRLLSRLRRSTPPVIARIENDRLVFDPRTVMPDQEEALLAAIRQILPELTV